MPKAFDRCDNDIELPREEAVAGAIARWDPKPATEWVSLAASFGRTIARDVASANELPNHLTSFRDGVAVYYSRFEGGMPDTSSWERGVDWEYANTGIGVPGDFDTCVLIEQVTFDEEGHIGFAELPARKGDKTVAPGSELALGERVASRGEVVTPSLAARLAKGGQTLVPVAARPRVSFLPTGSELVPPGADLPPRKNVDANSTLILGKLLDAGAEPTVYPISKDDPEVLRERLLQAVRSSDLVVINAGSSKGTDDFGHQAVAELGTIYNHQVSTGPGKHTMYAEIEGVPVVGLSGPTVCCDYTFDWYVRPLLAHFLGQPALVFPKLRARAAADFGSVGKRLTFMRGSHAFYDAEGRLLVLPASGMPGQAGHAGAAAAGEKGGRHGGTAGGTAGAGGSPHAPAGRLAVNCFVAMGPGFSAAAGDEVEVELRYPFASPACEPELAR